MAERSLLKEGLSLQGTVPAGPAALKPF